MNIANGLIDPAKGQDSQGETSRRILDAAYALFLDFGFRRMTMEDVARRVGVSRITIYRHYKDKDALFQAVALREGARSLRNIQQQLVPLHDKPEALFVESFVLTAQAASNHPLIKRLLETEPEWLLPHLTVKSGQLFEMSILYCSNFLSDLQKQGQLQPLPVKVVAEVLVRLLQSAVLTPGGLMASKNEEDLRHVANLLLIPLRNR